MTPTDDAMDKSLQPLRLPPTDPTLEFHAITLTGDPNGDLSLTTFSQWVGWQDDSCRVEMRVSSPVSASYAAKLSKIGISSIFVLDPNDVPLFLLAGGLGLVERNLAELCFPELTQPYPAYALGRSGFVSESLLEPGALKRAARPKKRMTVLNRDGRRCRICGRRPEDYVDLELHLHHIRPWENGGVTDSRNLITLCHTCHKGLEPHFDQSLFDLVDEQGALTFLRILEDGIARYRKAAPLRKLWSYQAN